MTIISQHGERDLLLDKTGRDTIWLNHAITLGNILHVTGRKNHTTVLMPDSILKTKCAFDIMGASKIRVRKDTIILRNITIEGFETGIHVSGHVSIRLENVFFRKVEQPVTYTAADSIKTEHLSF